MGMEALKNVLQAQVLLVKKAQEGPVEPVPSIVDEVDDEKGGKPGDALPADPLAPLT